jgi:CRP-like cAMP-binding protein
VVNLAVLLRADSTFTDCFMQLAGTGHSIEAEQMIGLMEARPAIMRLVLLHAYVTLAQTAATAFTNGRASVSARLARWLLMCHDRVDGDAVEITHESIAGMLGVRRPGVTTALGDLERLGLVAPRRGAVAVMDRGG